MQAQRLFSSGLWFGPQWSTHSMFWLINLQHWSECDPKQRISPGCVRHSSAHSVSNWRKVFGGIHQRSTNSALISQVIRKCGMGQVQNGRLYLRYESSSVITIAKCDETVTGKNPWLNYCKKSPRSFATPHKSWEKQTWKLWFCYPSLFFFITHNSKTITCIWMFYMSNKSSTTGEVPLLIILYRGTKFSVKIKVM